MISMRNLVKTYEDRSGGARVVAVDNVSFDVKPGEFFTLLGPSGCGKTTSLRMLAGLSEPDSGVITVRDRVLFDSDASINVPPHRRGLGMVFQSYAIWPHMTVFKNVAFPMTGRTQRKKGASRAEVTAKVRDALALVQLDGLEERQATDLSGGQQQRLALARALVTEPEVLLLDEPLSNLDAKLRESMRFELKKIQREIGITTIYVTHDQTEALALSNTIAVMSNGKLEQVGSPNDIYNKPASRFVADFIGITNLLDGTASEALGAGEMRVSTEHGDIVVKPQDADIAVGDPVIVSIRPEHITMTEAPTGAPSTNQWRGVVETQAFEGAAVQHQVRVGEALVRVVCNPTMAQQPGVSVSLDIPTEWCSVISKQLAE